jgi:type II secretory pathway pseudopilin PulG
MKPAANPFEPQRGSTLLVALIMLVLLTLVAISAMNSTTSSIQIVGNSQFREEARTLAQQAIEGVISYNFTVLPPATSSVGFDINMDGTTDYTACVPTPVCMGSKPIQNTDLNPNVAADVPCFSSSTPPNTGIMYASGVPNVTGMSWCLSQQWEVQAKVTDTSLSGAKVNVHQGIGMRVPAGTICSVTAGTLCP